MDFGSLMQENFQQANSINSSAGSRECEDYRISETWHSWNSVLGEHPNCREPTHRHTVKLVNIADSGLHSSGSRSRCGWLRLYLLLA